MATLTEREKAEIVRLLACYRTPSQVAVEMRASGVEVDRFQVRAYDPTNPRFEAGERWRALFEKERAAFIGEIDDIPIAKPAFRLNMLQQHLEAARQAGNLVLANAILKQAAWEVGRLPVEPAGAWRPASSAYDGMSPEERRAEMLRLVGEALKAREAKQNAAHSEAGPPRGVPGPMRVAA